jgi:hypothetical protein
MDLDAPYICRTTELLEGLVELNIVLDEGKNGVGVIQIIVPYFRAVLGDERKIGSQQLILATSEVLQGVIAPSSKKWDLDFSI